MIRTPVMNKASLAGIPGSGVITLLRDEKDDVVEAHGTFRPENDRADLRALIEASQQGRKVVYEGTVSDGQGQGVRDEQARLEVEVVRIENYTDLDGDKHLLVSFLSPSSHQPHPIAPRVDNRRRPGL